MVPGEPSCWNRFPSGGGSDGAEGDVRLMTKRRLCIILLCIGLPVAAILSVLRWLNRDLYTVTVLPRFEMRVVVPCSINDRGQIVGFSHGRFCLWEQGADWRALGRASDHGLYINNAGQIAGTLDDPNGRGRAFLWDPAAGVRFIGTLGGADSQARAINNLGQIVGVSETSSGLDQAFFWDKTAGMRDLGLHDASAINDAGQVIVFSYGRALLVEAGRADNQGTEIPPVGKNYMSPVYGINNRGYVCSEDVNPARQRTYIFTWRRDGSIAWLFPRGDRTIYSAAFNDANQVAVSEAVPYPGWLARLTRRYLGPSRRSFVWTPQRGRVFLDRYVCEQSGDYFNVIDLNNKGCIIGTIHRDTGSIRDVVLLEPIPGRWGK